MYVQTAEAVYNAIDKKRDYKILKSTRLVLIASDETGFVEILTSKPMANFVEGKKLS